MERSALANAEHNHIGFLSSSYKTQQQQHQQQQHFMYSPRHFSSPLLPPALVLIVMLSCAIPVSLLLYMLQSLSNAFGFQFVHGIFAMLLLFAIYLSSSLAMVFVLSTTFTIELNNSNELNRKSHITHDVQIRSIKMSKRICNRMYKVVL